MLTVPRPDNLSTKHREVTSDVFNICERIKEVDPHLRVVLHEGHERPWVVVEQCHDGVERMVSRYERLDAGILEHLRYMLAVPADERMKRLMHEIDEHNSKIEDFGMSEERFEEFSYDFHKALVDSNMIDSKWGRYRMGR